MRPEKLARLVAELGEFAQANRREAEAKGYRENWYVSDACRHLNISRPNWPLVRDRAILLGIPLVCRKRMGYSLARTESELADLPVHQATIGHAILVKAFPRSTQAGERHGLEARVLRAKLLEAGIQPERLAKALEGFDLRLSMPEFIALLEAPEE